MKKTLTIIGLLAILALPLAAQTNIPPAGAPPTQASLPGTIVDYFTSLNTNLDTTFGDNSFTLWIGASSIQNGPVSLVNDLGASYDVFHLSSSNAVTKTVLSLDLNERNSGVAGTVVSAQGGVSFGVVIHDVRASLYLDGGDFLMKTSDNNGGVFGEIGLRIFKAIGPHFFIGVGMGAQFPDSRQVFSAFSGATF